MQSPRLTWLKLTQPELFEDEEKVYFRIGSALDCLLTSPERWDDDFVVGDVYKPYGLMLKFIVNLPSGLNEESPLELFQEAYDKAGYKKSLSWVVEQLWSTEKNVEYYKWIKETPENKVALSKDEYFQVLKCKELLLANEFCRRYFFEEAGTELMHQVPIYFEYVLDDVNYECKALLDGVLIDHESKTIQPFDLKTTGKAVVDFEMSFLHFGYYRQAAWYEMALYSAASPLVELLQQGYEMLDFIFIVVETKQDSHTPAMIFRTSPKDRLAGIEGGYTKGRYWPGVNELLKSYRWHKDNNYWNLPMGVFLNRGETPLNTF